MHPLFHFANPLPEHIQHVPSIDHKLFHEFISFFQLILQIFVSAGIMVDVFLLFRNVYDRISDKWNDRWQYYEVTGVKSLRKAVMVALCIISVTFALIAGKYIPEDINVVSWWIGFSVVLNLLYHGCCKNGY